MTAVRRDLPSGTVTFLFTDIEGSTKLLHELGADGYSKALAEHRRILREAFTSHGGVEVDTQGDAFFVAFPTASGALEAAIESREALASGPIRVRMGVHTGTPHLSDEGYVGQDVHKGARIGAAGHGGQVLLSKETHELAPVDVTDLGEHRLKDFDEPVWIFQLGDERFPPLKTISNTNLPRPVSSFVGRQREVDEVASLLRDGARLLTLTGPGGSGKTRLAIEAAAELVPEFKAGVFWVGLAPVRDPALVPDEIAQTVGAKDGLAKHIGERELLLLLDNFEQVIHAAPELASLAETCPNLTLLVTSRELLRVRGEVEYPVLPLADPEAVELFCARARAGPDPTVERLCRALDNLPLALELAAARASVLSPAQILERLSGRLDLLKGGRDSDPRQQTLRTTIEWSYELLDERERRLFARLAVFAGGCTLETAEDAVDAELDTLQSLVDKSLIRHTEGRFWMLETIREYATERLEQLGDDDEMRRRHAEHFLALSEEAGPYVQRPVGSKEWHDRLELEHDNLRAALDRFEALGEGEHALRLVGALFDFWGERGHVAEGRRRLEAALRMEDQPSPPRAKALIGASLMSSISGDLGAATLQADEALALHRLLGDAWGVARAVHSLGYALGEQGDWERARQMFEESAGAFRDVGDEQYALWVTRSLAWTYEELGDRQHARALQEDSLRRARALGDRTLEAVLLGSLSMIAIDDGRAEDALSLMRENLPIYRELADPLKLTENLSRSAHALAAVGRAATAARLLFCSEALFEELGARVPWVERMNEQTLATIRTQLDGAAVDEASKQGRALTADAAISLALESLD
jgi:predicted ATPase/class 3 adenylate cyclase